MGEQSMFKSELQSRQPEVDEAMRVMKKTTAPPPPADLPPSNPDSPMSNSMHQSMINVNSPRSISTSSSHLYHPLSPTKKSFSKGRLVDKPSKSERQKISETLAESWKQLLADTEDYEQRLKQRKAYLEEMKRLEKFTFDDWRERYLQWNDV
jgi:hypothetical protein